MRTIALVAAVLVSTAALADTTTRYTVLFQDRPGGSQVTTVRADGRIDVDMSYRNNGRGPDIREHSRFAPDGTLVSFQVSGKSTFGAPISESYALHGNQAQWRSVADHGEATVTAPAVYVPVDSSFEAFAVIVRAALRQRENRIAALPGGELTVRKVLDGKLQGSGYSAAVALYAIIGIDTQPDFLWLTAGSSPRFFALVIPGYLRVILAECAPASRTGRVRVPRPYRRALPGGLQGPCRLGHRRRRPCAHAGAV